MPQTIEDVQNLSANTTKAVVRTLIDHVIDFYTKSIKEVRGMSMCGVDATHEINRIKKNPNEKIICVERDVDKVQLVQNKLPEQCELCYGDWNNQFKKECKNLNWAWADTCDNPTLQNVYNRFVEIQHVCRHSFQNNFKIFSVTFDLRCRGIVGGQKEAIKKLVSNISKIKSSQYDLSIEHSENKSIALIKAIAQYLGKSPHSIIYYHGGKNNRTPMVTIIYNCDFRKQNFSWKQKGGYKDTHFIDLTKVKKGLSSFEIETHSFKQSLNLSEIICSDIQPKTEKEISMIKTNVELTREDYSKAIRALADQGLTNEKIATMLNISRKKVGGVMAWKNNRSSWEK